jgi:hypothetical protein
MFRTGQQSAGVALFLSNVPENSLLNLTNQCPGSHQVPLQRPGNPMSIGRTWDQHFDFSITNFRVRSRFIILCLFLCPFSHFSWLSLKRIARSRSKLQLPFAQFSFRICSCRCNSTIAPKSISSNDRGTRWNSHQVQTCFSEGLGPSARQF